MSVLQRIWKAGWLCWRPTRDIGMAFGTGLLGRNLDSVK